MTLHPAPTPAPARPGSPPQGWSWRTFVKQSAAYRVLRALYHPRETFKAMKRRITRDSIFREEGELFMCSLLPEPLLEAVLSELRPKSVLDVGCGTGRSLDYFLARGVDVLGVEGSELAISKALHPESITLWNLNEELNLKRRFDLVWCFEVVEHIHAEHSGNLIRTLTNHADCLVMSAAHPGQGGEGHFNEQPRTYWIERLAAVGFHHDDRVRDALIHRWDWFPENIFVFRKAVPGATEKA